jgi:hypothetical protein
MKRTILRRLEKKAIARREFLRRHCFSKFYHYKDRTLRDAVDILQKHRDAVKAELDYLHFYTKLRKWPCDFRKGEETYGFENDEAILTDLFYISDRFIVEFRLQWVLDLIEKYKK